MSGSHAGLVLLAADWFRLEQFHGSNDSDFVHLLSSFGTLAADLILLLKMQLCLSLHDPHLLLKGQVCSSIRIKCSMLIANRLALTTDLAIPQWCRSLTVTQDTTTFWLFCDMFRLQTSPHRCHMLTLQ